MGIVNIAVALDGPRERTLRFYAGDEATITLYVYAQDGDGVPLTVTTPRMVIPCWPAALTDSILIGAEFVVPSTGGPRVRYRLVGEIAGVTKTLAFGDLLIEGSTGSYRRWDYGFEWGCCA